MAIKRIIKEKYKQLYAHKFDNLDKMSHKRHNLQNLTQEETDNLNRPISFKEIKFIVNNLPKQKSPGADDFASEFYQTFNKGFMPILYNLFQRIEAEEILPNSFNEANIILVKKSDKDIIRKEAFLLISGTMQGCPLLQLRFNVIVKGFVNAIRQVKEIKGIQIRKKVKNLSLQMTGSSM